MSKSNPFIKKIKSINKIINNLLEENLNKLKSENLINLLRNNKIVLTFVAVIILFVSYLLLPTLYKQDQISKKLKNLQEAVFYLWKDLATIDHKASIIFAPACASFDQFENFEKRGDEFKKLSKHYARKYI